MLGRTIEYSCVISVIWVFTGIFPYIYSMTKGGPGKATNVVVQWIYNTAFDDFRLDRAATVSVVFFVILLVCTALTMRYSNRNANYDQ